MQQCIAAWQLKDPVIPRRGYAQDDKNSSGMQADVHSFIEFVAHHNTS